MSFLSMLPLVEAPSTQGHSWVLPFFEHCSQQNSYVPMDLHVLLPFLKLLPATALSTLGHIRMLPPFARF
jgi:hypothetical protein